MNTNSGQTGQGHGRHRRNHRGQEILEYGAEAEPNQMSDVDDYVSKVDPKLRSQFQTLRSIIKKALPGAFEAVKWGVPFYSLDGVGVAALADYSEHLNLALMHGAELSSDLLKGTGKGMRHITVSTMSDIDEKEITRVLREAGALAAEGPRRKKRRTKRR